MARKPKTLIDEDLGAGIGPEDNDEEQLIKIVEPPPNENKSGIVVEDAPMPDGLKDDDAADAPADDDERPYHPLSISAQERLDAEMALGRENVAKAAPPKRRKKED